jgi:hypothetical protein
VEGGLSGDLGGSFDIDRDFGYFGSIALKRHEEKRDMLHDI